ncbi:MAG TPA: hypothetical protein VFV68_07680, partial [Agriterribacter sp.]|nr:hypothetical protein [Agriterribacter sp.]
MRQWTLLLLGLAATGCSQQQNGKPNPVSHYTDIPYQQDYSIKYNMAEPGVTLQKVYADRNGVIKILS